MAIVRPLQLELPIKHLRNDSPFEDFPSPIGHEQENQRLPRHGQLVSQAKDLAHKISLGLGKQVRLFITDNRSTMISYRNAGGGVAVRVHHMFLAAPEPVVQAICDYIGGGQRDSAELVIDQFVRQNSNSIRTEEFNLVSSRLDPRGLVWNLQEIYAELNRLYFQDTIRARIGWSRYPRNSRKKRRTIRMGVYDHLSKTIRIHPSLDRREVPQFFVEYIVFHEMLHQAIPSKQLGNRRLHHSAEFRAREATFIHYAQAITWERANIQFLLGRTNMVQNLTIAALSLGS